MKRTAPAISVAAVLAFGVLLVWKPWRDAPSFQAEPGKPLTLPAPKPLVPPSADARKALLTRLVTLEGGAAREEVQRLAMDLRRNARGDEAFLLQLAALLRDESKSADVRNLAAFVLGSLPQPEARRALLDALAASNDAAWTRTLLLAVGSDKDSGDDDDAFDLGDSPWVMEVPPGLSVRIKTVLDDPLARDQVRLLLGTSPHREVREAATRALAHSLRHQDVREGFVNQLAIESDPELQGEVARGLSDWASAEPAGSSDRMRVTAAILEKGALADSDAVRFRSEDGLKRMAMTESEVRALSAWLLNGTLDQRRWALAVLGSKASQGGLPARDDLFAAFERIVTADGEAKAREWAVTALASYPDRPRSGELLLGALSDPAWHVRTAAIRAIARLPRSETAIAVLRRAAEGDADENVRRAADQALRQWSVR